MLSLTFSILWILLIALIAKPVAMALIDRNLLVYSQNSNQSFASLWNNTSGFNDDGNKNLADFSSILGSGNFRAEIRESWGAPTDFVLHLVSERGYTIGDMLFDVADVNVTGLSSNMSSWFNTQRLVEWWPQYVDMKNIEITTRDGDRELTITESPSSGAWFSIVHNSSFFNPAIVLARNSTSLMSTSWSVEDILYEGCYPSSEVSASPMYQDSSSMTVESCFLKCKDYFYIGMQFGDTCYCASLLSQTSPLDTMCRLPCPGNASQNCGGTGVEYWAVYSGIIKPDDLENPAESSSVLLLNHTDTTYLHNDTFIDIAKQLAWYDGYAYIDNISVYALTEANEYTGYTFKFLTGNSQEHEIYADDVEDPPLEFPTNGSHIKIDTLPMLELIIYFKEPVKNSTILLYGPNETYVVIPHIVLTGTFVDFTTSSTVSTTTTTTSETSPNTTANTTAASGNLTASSGTSSTQATTPSASSSTTNATSLSPTTTNATSLSTTTTSTTTPDPYAMCSVNNSTMLLINGQTYCPCSLNATVNTNETLDIEAVVAELTVDKTQVSAYTRKFTSAEDNRPSAQTIGSFGVIIFILEIAAVLYLDSTALLREIGRLRHNYKYLKRRLSKRSLKVNISENTETNSETQRKSNPVDGISAKEEITQVSE